MSETEPKVLVAMSPRQAGIVTQALITAKRETQSHLTSYPSTDEPRPTDSCCLAHRSFFEDRLRQRGVLRDRVDLIDELIAAIEPIADGLAPEVEIGLDAVVLVYRDEDGEDHEQPLPDITSAGTLIDPDSGDDLELRTAVHRPSTRS